MYKSTQSCTQMKRCARNCIRHTFNDAQTYIHVYIYIYIYTHTYNIQSTYTNTQTHTQLYKRYIQTLTALYIKKHIYIYIYIYIHTHTHTHTYTTRRYAKFSCIFFPAERGTRSTRSPRRCCCVCSRLQSSSRSAVGSDDALSLARHVGWSAFCRLYNLVSAVTCVCYVYIYKILCLFSVVFLCVFGCCYLALCIFFHLYIYIYIYIYIHVLTFIFHIVFNVFAYILIHVFICSICVHIYIYIYICVCVSHMRLHVFHSFQFDFKYFLNIFHMFNICSYFRIRFCRYWCIVSYVFYTC